MTTNQTIDGVLVSREWLENIYRNGLGGFNVTTRTTPREELRALLDAPALELIEPVAPWFYFVECDDPDYSGLFNHESEAQTQANDHGGSVVKLWNVPPTYKPAAQPQGEPVAWLMKCKNSGFFEQAEPNEKASNPMYWTDAFPVYAEQPAPVAVVLPVDPERERLMEIVQQYPNVDPLEYKAAVRTLRK